METYKFSKEWMLKTVSQRPTKRLEFKDQDNRFLRLVIHPGGKSTLCVYKCPRNQRNAVRVSLPFAINMAMPNMQKIRSEANKVIANLDQGINPNSSKNKKNKVLTLKEGIDNYLSGSTNTMAVNKNWSFVMNTYLTPWLKEPLKNLCTPKKIYTMHRIIMNKIGETNKSKSKGGDGGIGANEVIKKLRRVINFNRSLDAEYDLPRWPADELGPNGLKMWIPQKPRTRRIHKEEFGLFWEALHQLACPIQRDLFKFLLLTGCRSSEARQLTPESINLNRWSATFKDTKNKLDHTIPLSKTLREIISDRLMKTSKGYLFPLNDPKCITKHIKASSGLNISPHDLRRTFAGVAEVAGIGSTIKKDLLNHLSGRDVTDDYTGKTDFDDLREALEKIESKILEFVGASQSNQSLLPK